MSKKKKKLKKLKKIIHKDTVKLKEEQKRIISLKRQLKRLGKSNARLKEELSDYQNTLKTIDALCLKNNSKNSKRKKR